MAKRLKDILEAAIDAKHHGRENAEGEVQFKKKHTDNVEIKDYPVDSKNQHKADKVKKDKSKRTHIEPEAEKLAYEETMAEVEDILAEDELAIEGVLEQLKSIVSSGQDAEITLIDDTQMEVDVETASAITDVMEFLNDDNVDTFVEKLENNQEDFLRMVDFAIQMRGGE